MHKLLGAEKVSARLTVYPAFFLWEFAARVRRWAQRARDDLVSGKAMLGGFCTSFILGEKVLLEIPERN